MHYYEQKLFESITAENLPEEKRLSLAKAAITAIKTLRAASFDIHKNFNTTAGLNEAIPDSQPNIDVVDENKCTPLIKAFNLQRTAIAIELIDAGSDLYKKWDLDGSALVSFAEKPSNQVWNKLIEKKIDFNKPITENEHTLLTAAAWFNTDITIKLIDLKVNLDHQNKCLDTALMIAAFKNDIQIVQALVKAKANIHLKNKNEMNALDFAIKNKNINLVLEFLEHKSIPKNPTELCKILTEAEPDKETEVERCLTLLNNQKFDAKELQLYHKIYFDRAVAQQEKQPEQALKYFSQYFNYTQDKKAFMPLAKLEQKLKKLEAATHHYAQTIDCALQEKNYDALVSTLSELKTLYDVCEDKRPIENIVTKIFNNVDQNNQNYSTLSERSYLIANNEIKTKLDNFKFDQRTKALIEKPDDKGIGELIQLADTNREVHRITDLEKAISEWVNKFCQLKSEDNDAKVIALLFEQSEQEKSINAKMALQKIFNNLDITSNYIRHSNLYKLKLEFLADYKLTSSEKSETEKKYLATLSMAIQNRKRDETLIVGCNNLKVATRRSRTYHIRSLAMRYLCEHEKKQVILELARNDYLPAIFTIAKQFEEKKRIRPTLSLYAHVLALLSENDNVKMAEIFNVQECIVNFWRASASRFIQQCTRSGPQQPLAQWLIQFINFMTTKHINLMETTAYPLYQILQTVIMEWDSISNTITLVSSDQIKKSYLDGLQSALGKYFQSQAVTFEPPSHEVQAKIIDLFNNQPKQAPPPPPYSPPRVTTRTLPSAPPPPSNLYPSLFQFRKVSPTYVPINDETDVPKFEI